MSWTITLLWGSSFLVIHLTGWSVFTFRSLNLGLRMTGHTEVRNCTAQSCEYTTCFWNVSCFVNVAYAPKIFKANSIRNRMNRPTFKQFVTYILGLKNIASFNDHWIPQWLHCNICQWDYQVPGRTLIEILRIDTQSKSTLKRPHWDIGWRQWSHPPESQNQHNLALEQHKQASATWTEQKSSDGRN